MKAKKNSSILLKVRTYGETVLDFVIIESVCGMSAYALFRMGNACVEIADSPAAQILCFALLLVMSALLFIAIGVLPLAFVDQLKSDRHIIESYEIAALENESED